MGKITFFVVIFLAYAEMEKPENIEFRFGMLLTVLLVLLIAAPLVHVVRKRRFYLYVCHIVILVVGNCYLKLRFSEGNYPNKERRYSSNSTYRLGHLSFLHVVVVCLSHRQSHCFRKYSCVVIQILSRKIIL